MKIGDLVTHGWNKDTGIITHIFDVDDAQAPDGVSVLFEDGEYQVRAEDCEVINEAG